MCDQPHIDEYANQWEITKTVEKYDDIYAVFRHFNTLETSYIYCYPSNITVEGVVYACPPYVFKMPISTAYRTGALVHDTSIKLINPTYSGKIIDRIDAGLFEEDMFNREIITAIKNSVKYKQLEKELTTEKIILPKREAYVGLGLSSLMILFFFGYLLYKFGPLIFNSVMNKVSKKKPETSSEDNHPPTERIALEQQTGPNAPVYEFVKNGIHYPNAIVHSAYQPPHVPQRKDPVPVVKK